MSLLHAMKRFWPSSHYLLLALLFFAGLELISVFHHWIIALSLILLALITYGIFLIRYEERPGFHPLQSILPGLTAGGLIGFSLFLPTNNFLHLYDISAAFVLFWLLKHGARQAYPTWNWSLATLILFLNLAVILGLHFHLFLPLWFTLALTGLVIFLISLQGLYRVAQLPTAVLLSLGLALALTQLAWVLQFLSIHFLIQSGVILVFFYVYFHLLELSLEQKIRRRDIIEYAALGIACLALTLLTARWI